MTNSDIGNNIVQKSKKIILTFDDGPHPIWTHNLLDLLNKYDVKATFFLVGKKVQKYPHLVREIINQGHIAGNHTWSHRILIAVNNNILKREIHEYDLYFKDNFNYTMKFFRPPWGFLTRKTAAIIEKRYGYKILTWNKDSMDYLLPCHRNISHIIFSKTMNPLIILFHDGVILSPIFTRKYCMRTIEKLLKIKSDNIEFVLPDNG
jgi:peptidoglycan/xylan/chitin deacetylase (PgdA/CDA1 family)